MDFDTELHDMPFRTLNLDSIKELESPYTVAEVVSALKDMSPS